MDRSSESGKDRPGYGRPYASIFYIPPGKEGNRFPILVVGQDQVARVDATSTELKVTLTSTKTKEIVYCFTVPRSGMK